ncbi:hypothetical protein ABW19_dt0205126 [Dactylella cylindrospora]|nr:hypothetical protein ABW19_dt0205126 [Dactylella cylindrospora]
MRFLSLWWRRAPSQPVSTAVRAREFGFIYQGFGYRLSSTSLPPQADPLDEKELSQARAWLKTFTQHKIPRNLFELSFSRSAGPGGQNVNKYLGGGGSELVISSDSTRSQAKNIEHCYQKLYDAIIQSVQIPGETSAEQKQRVQNL